MDSTLAAGYDGFDLRAWKTDSAGTTYYLYDDDSTSPACELSSSGAVTATNTYTANGLVSRRTSTGSTFYEFDPQGSVSARLNSAGSCTSSSITDGFGKVVNSATTADPFGYEAQAGYVTDPATGLILTTFRYYDPSSGRFLNRDPIGYGGGINVYAYCANRPSVTADPLGLWEVGVGVGGTIFNGTGFGVAGGVTLSGGIYVDSNGTIGFSWSTGSFLSGTGEYVGAGFGGTYGTGNLGDPSSGSPIVYSGPYPIAGVQGGWGPVEGSVTNGGCNGYTVSLGPWESGGGYGGAYGGLSGSGGVNIPNTWTTILNDIQNMYPNPGQPPWSLPPLPGPGPSPWPSI